MNDQEIRAAAAQAAAVLMAPSAPSPADYVAVAEVVEAYIREGKNAAFALCAIPEEQPVEIPARQATVVQAVASPVPAPVQYAPPVPAPEPEVTAKPEIAEVRKDADVISLPTRDAPSPKQNAARSIVERRRKERVDSIMAEASVAKVKAHKERLLGDAEDAGLSDFPVTVKGQNMTLGAYLASLLGS